MAVNNETRMLQIQIYTRKFFRTLRKESIISIIIGVLITMLVMFVTESDMFNGFEGTQAGFFSLICVCIWVGIFNSIQLVCREKNDIVKDELDKSLHASSYMAAHFIYQFLLCLVQSIIIFAIFWMWHSDSAPGGAMEYFITIFLATFAADAMAFVVSCAVPNPIVAMTVMPLLLLVQLVLAGVLFKLDGATEIIAYFTISRWGIAAFGTSSNITDMFSPIGVQGWQKDLYSSDIATSWLLFAVFIVVFFFLSVIALKATTKRIKK